jgi:hypothetical protein
MQRWLALAVGARPPSEIGGDVETLDAETRRLLEVVVDVFHSTGEWPLVEDLRHDLDAADDDLDVKDVGRRLPPALGSVDIGYRGRIRLTLLGILLSGRGREELSDCLALVQFAYQRYRQSKPGVRIESAEFGAAAGLEPLRLAKVGELLLSLPGLGNGGRASEDPASWYRLVDADIDTFKHTSTVEEMIDKVPVSGGLGVASPGEAMKAPTGAIRRHRAPTSAAPPNQRATTDWRRLSPAAAKAREDLKGLGSPLLGPAQPFRVTHRAGGVARITHPSLTPGWLEIPEIAIQELIRTGAFLSAPGDGDDSYFLTEDEDAAEPARARASLVIGEAEHRGRGAVVFISVIEAFKVQLGFRFRERLKPNVRGIVVSDEPQPVGTYGPEEKVDAYLDLADAVVVFATHDPDEPTSAKARSNISDELARARSRQHLATHICVLKERGVSLQSNTNPTYEDLDPEQPEDAFRRALRQLKEWGFDVEVPDAPSDMDTSAPVRRQSPGPSPDAEPDADLERAGLTLALEQVRGVAGSVRTPSVALAVVALPRGPLLRPAELEDPELGGRIERQALYGDHPVLERGQATRTSMQGNNLIARQDRASISIDGEGTLLIVQALGRADRPGLEVSAVIEEDVITELERALGFAYQTLAEIDHAGRVQHVIMVASLLGAGYSGWRTRAEHLASPTSMNLDIRGENALVTPLSPPSRARTAIRDDRPGIARDLMVLLRREARGGR